MNDLNVFESLEQANPLLSLFNQINAARSPEELPQDLLAEIAHTPFGERLHEMYKTGLRPETIGFMLRHVLVSRYAWAIPSQEAIERIALNPSVEIGAGSGYWASLVRAAEGDIIATDVDPWDNAHTKVDTMDAETAARLAAYSRRTLVTIWPEYDERWTSRALEIYLENAGKEVIYVGEHAGGCTGDSMFHHLLKTCMELKETIVIPRWYGIHDYLFVYGRS